MLSNFSPFRSWSSYSRALTTALLCIDGAVWVCAFKLQEMMVYPTVPDLASQAFISLLAWTIAACCYQLYMPEKVTSVFTILRKHLAAWPLALLIQLIVFIVLPSGTAQLVPVLIFNLCGFTLIITLKTLLLLLYMQLRQRNKNRYVIVGYTPAGKRLHHYLQHKKSFSYTFLGFFDDVYTGQTAIKGSIQELYLYCMQQHVDHIYLAINHDPALTRALADFADKNFIYFGYVTHPLPILEETNEPQPKINLIPLSTINLGY